MKKKLVAIYMILLMLGSPTGAMANPAVIVWGAAAAGTFLFMAGGVKYYLPANMANYMPSMFPDGSLWRIAVATFNVMNKYQQEQLASKMVAAKMAYNDAKAALQASASGLYNNLKKAFFYQDYGYNWRPDIPLLVPGDSVSVGAGTYRILSGPEIVNEYICRTDATAIPDSRVEGSPLQFTCYYKAGGCGPGMTWIAYNKYIVTPGLKDPAAKPVDKTRQKINDAALLPTMQPEIDDLIKSNPNIVHFYDTETLTDAETAPPFVLPVDGTTVPEPVGGLGEQNKTAQQQKVANAQASVAAAQAALAANPGDPALQAALEKALEELAQAQKDLLEAKTATETAFPDAISEGLKKLDYTKWKQLIGIMSTTFPFSLVANLNNTVAQLVSTPAAPSYVLHIYGSQKLNINLSMFDPIAAIIRWLLGLFLTYSGIQYLINYYRGK